MRPGTRFESRSPVTVDFAKGLDLSAYPSQIADNAASRLINFHYPYGNRRPASRPVLRCVTTTALPSPITVLAPFIYRQSGTTIEEMVCVTEEKKVYRLRPGDTEWTQIGSTVLTTAKPCLKQFGPDLFIADGAGGLKFYNGTAITAVAGSIPQPDWLEETANRLWANDGREAERDMVYASKIKDAITDASGTTVAWKLLDAGGDAVGVPCGHGENHRVVGMCRLPGNNLAVFKNSGTEKHVYRVDASWTTDQWASQGVNYLNGPRDGFCAAAFGQLIYYLDEDGFGAMQPTADSVDFTKSPFGRKIEDYLSQFSFGTHAQVVPLSSLQCLWVSPDLAEGDARRNEHFLFYYPQESAEDSRWCLWELPASINYVAEWRGAVYLGGDNGLLYTLYDDDGRDEVEPGEFADLVSVARTKVFSVPTASTIAPKVEATLDFIKAGAVEIAYYKADLGDKFVAGLWDFPNRYRGGELYDGNSDLADAVQLMNDVTQAPFRARGRIKSSGIAIQVRIIGGRAVIGQLYCELAPVGR